MSWSARDEDGAREFFEADAFIRKKAKHLAQLLKSAKHAIVFTGAGISTSAGIPDFRSGLRTQLKTGPGLWAAQAAYEQKNPVRNEFSKNDPNRPKVDLNLMLEVQPTFTHRAIAKLVEVGYVRTVMTQNVDNLHRKSGVDRKNLIELHGNLQCEKCESCGLEYERDFRIGPNGGNNHYTGRNCDSCGGFLKDYLVPFGEDLPESETDRAWRESSVADLCLAIGSSMTVTPACDYAAWVSGKTKKRLEPWSYHSDVALAGKLAIINIQKTPHDADADTVIHGYCDQVMQALMEHLELSC